MEEWRHRTEIKEKLFLERGQTLKDLYLRIAERHPLLRSVVEGGQFLGVQIHSSGQEVPRYESSVLSKIPVAAWSNEIHDEDLVVFIQPPIAF
jgi:hypothetical protein